MAFAALHRTLSYRGEDTGLFVIAGQDGSEFFSRKKPALFDSMAKPVAAREILPGSIINVRFQFRPEYRQIEAVQIVTETAPPCPFEPVFEAAEG